jgi:hypothetical protein
MVSQRPSGHLSGHKAAVKEESESAPRDSGGHPHLRYLYRTRRIRHINPIQWKNPLSRELGNGYCQADLN